MEELATRETDVNLSTPSLTTAKGITWTGPFGKVLLFLSYSKVDAVGGRPLLEGEIIRHEDGWTVDVGPDVYWYRDGVAKPLASALKAYYR